MDQRHVTSASIRRCHEGAAIVVAAFLLVVRHQLLSRLNLDDVAEYL